MTNETRNRIRAYMQELPHMKEKAFGALIMLVVAACIALTSTYAWVTLSRSPEVSDITTTLAANGALEIALAKPDGSQPEEFDIDESVTENADVTVSNLQWGNLVNLSDASYGIDNMALRPAQLNTTSLLNSPLWGAVYGSDGRITNLDSSYAYAKYNGSQFLTSNEYGVRAIATYRAEISDATQQAYNERVQAVVTAHTNVNQVYANVAPKFSALGTMISKYAQNKLDDGYTDLAPYISNMIPLYNAVRDAMDAQKEAYVALANLQNYLYSNELGVPYAPLNWDGLYQNRTQYNTASADVKSSNGHISLVGLTQFIKDYEQLQKDIEYLETYYADYKANGSAYYWGGYYVDSNGTTVDDPSVSGYTLSNIVAHLIDYATMTIDLDNNGTETRVTALGMDNAGSLVSANGKERKVYAYNGILYRLEQSSVDHEFRINGNAACTINVTYLVMSITVYGKAYTKASGACTFMENYTTSLEAELVPNDAVAEDTYGLAIDLWLRTNAEETCLTLEGATSTDVQGNIVSYDGINRVWGSTGEAVLTTDSTTQGGGSCYIYYADTPEDMARSLDLLDAMKVAFVDSAGNLLATAQMDTANYWAVNGRITVPLVLDDQTKTTYTYTDEQNVQLTGYAVTTLYTDVPVRVTAIVYLDGTRLSNDDVLAAAEIQGTLNIQFGSSTDLKTVGSNELIDDTRSVTAMADVYELDYDTAQTDAELTTTVTLNVEGVQPNKVTAFFVRAINSTQGTREETMNFEKQADGSWTKSYKFDAPGTYYLRHVRLDGVDYALHEPLAITVSGFALKSVTWGETEDSVTALTSDSTYSVSVSAEFASSDATKMPGSVQIRFIRDDGNAVNVPLTYSSSSGKWTGTAQFSVSGVYTMEYLVYTIKGEDYGRYQDLGSFKKTLDLSLGMYVTVTDLSGGTEQEFDSDSLASNPEVYHKKVAVRVFNNAGAELEGLENLTLYYSNGASITNTINTVLTWDPTDHCYIGTLPIVSAGRYQFAYVALGTQLLNLAKESPVYTVVSPDPPVYNTGSVGTFTGDSIQFIPLATNAQLDGLRIKNSAAANISVVVYSAAADRYFERTLSEGTVINTGTNENQETSWTVNLPTYTLDLDADGNPTANAVYTQEGDWSVAAVMLSGCYDADGEFRGDDNPIVWGGSDNIGRNYLTNAELTADASYDFSGLTTTVSTSVNLSTTAETTALGGASTDFMTTFYTDGLDLRLFFKDDNGNPIPSGKIGSDMVLKVRYNVPSDDSYGYTVLSTLNGSTYELPMEYDAESGGYAISSAATDWQYVGDYTVTGLTVTIGGASRTYFPKDAGGNSVTYTVKTAGPNDDDVTVSVTQNRTELGKTGSNVTGTFLQSQALGQYIYAQLGLVGITGTNYVDMSSLVTGVDLELTYQDGTTAPNGGYSWSGTSAYESITLPMTNDSGSYKSGSTPMLSGTYSAKIVITLENGVEITEDLKNIAVYSKTPTLKVTGVTPGADKQYNVNLKTDGALYYYNNAEMTSVQNYYSEHYANVYIQATSQDDTEGQWGGALVDYTLPKVKLTLSNIGSNFTTATASVSNTMDGQTFTNTFEFSSATLADEAEIGLVQSDTFSYNYDTFLGQKLYRDVTYEKRYWLGEKQIDTIQVKESGNSNIEYSVTVETPITIRENNEAMPSITYASRDGYTTPAAQTSETGGAFQVTLPQSIGTIEKTEDVTDDSAVWEQVSSTTATYMYYKVTNTSSRVNSGSCGNPDTHYATYEFTYYLYERTTLVERTETVTTKFLKTYGVTGWKIGDTTYLPGETITVSGVVTATPVIGEVKAPTQLGEPMTKTITRTTTGPDVGPTTKVVSSGEQSSTTSADAAASLAAARYTAVKPSGNWLDDNDHTSSAKVMTQAEVVIQEQ